MKNALTVCLLVACFVSCSPSIGSKIALPNLIRAPEPLGDIGRPQYEGYVFIDELADKRGTQAMAKLDGREILSKSEVAPAVLTGLKDALYRKGFKFSDTAAILLSGEIREWFAQIEGGFRSSADAQAVLYIEVLDPANKRIYSGVYKGTATKESPNLSDKDVTAVLGVSMTEAIEQVIGDRQLMKLLSSF